MGFDNIVIRILLPAVRVIRVLVLLENGGERKLNEES